MTVVLGLASALAHAAAPVDVDNCEWNAGQNAYTGDKSEAVDQLTYIPKATREKLKAKMLQHEYSDKITIYKDRIEGEKGTYTARITNMRFGTNGRCKEVTRNKWAAGTTQTALVYSADGYSVIDPSVCRNIAQIYEAPPPLSFAPNWPELEPLQPVVPPLIPEIDTFVYIPPTGAGIPPETVTVNNWPIVITTGGGGYIGIPVTLPVPEPGAWAMFMSGLLMLIYLARKQARRVRNEYLAACPTTIQSDRLSC